jgi:hypothetical protein
MQRLQKLVRSLKIGITLLVLSQSAIAQLEVNNGMSPEGLVQDVLLGRGIVASNITYTGNSISIGQFNGLSTNLNIGNGVLLTTGSVQIAVGPNAQEDDGLTLPVSHNDADLAALIPGYSIYDATVLEFDFIATSNQVQFRYAFGSEEYMEWVNSSYNDVFGFFVSGPNPAGGQYIKQNIARIPGTNEVVSIDNVNLGKNSLYYVDNESPRGLSIEYDGFTKPLTAAISVVPGQVYHMKIAIGDAGDSAFDSGVFLEGNSFSSPNCPAAVLNTKTDCAGKPSTLSVWDNSDIELAATCDGSGNVLIDVTNVGTGDMSKSEELRIYNFATGSMTTQSYQLASGEIYSLTIASQGGTVLLQADQTPFNPNSIQENISVKGCSSGNFSVFHDNIISPVSVLWTFGDGATSTLLNSSHAYTSPGTYTVTLSYCNTSVQKQITIEGCPKLQLTPVCSNSPSTVRRWRIRNPNNYDVQTRWNIVGTSQQGEVLATALSDTYFESVPQGSNVLRLFAGTQLQAMRISTPRNCSAPDDCYQCIPSFSPTPTEKYILSAWVKEGNQANAISYQNAGVVLAFPGAETEVGPFKGSGAIIDGWQRIESEFVVPEGATSVIVKLTNEGAGDIFFDDIRIHPFHSNMKSFVYDPTSLRLMAELDENNYATFYEYDEEGALIRVKKETERGLVTIQESRNNTAKQP